MADLYEGEVEPIATDPVLRGVDLAMGRLIQRDCFTERTLRILDELRAEALAHSVETCDSCGIDPRYLTARHLLGHPEPGSSDPKDAH